TTGRTTPMRSVGLEYANGEISVELPDDSLVIEGLPPERIRPALSDPESALQQALAEPLGMPRLDELVDSRSRVTLTVNDWMGGSYYAAPAVLDLLKRRGVSERNVRIVIAGGTHAKVTRKQLYASNMGRWSRNNQPPFPEQFRILPPEIIESWS